MTMMAETYMLFVLIAGQGADPTMHQVPVSKQTCREQLAVFEAHGPFFMALSEPVFAGRALQVYCVAPDGRITTTKRKI
jgi:hypothetical protein